MGVVRVLEIPNFEHPLSGYCGPYDVKFILATLGQVYEVRKLPFFRHLVRRTFPKDMPRLFPPRHSAKIVDILRTDRINWIKGCVRMGTCPALFVWTSRWMPIPHHWMVVAGYDDEKEVFFIYDSRVGKGSYDPTLPIGNAVWSYNQMRKEWVTRSEISVAVVCTTAGGVNKQQTPR